MYQWGASAASAAGEGGRKAGGRRQINPRRACRSFHVEHGRKLLHVEHRKQAPEKSCATLYCYASENSRITGESVLSYCFIDRKKKAVIKPFTGLNKHIIKRWHSTNNIQ